MATKILFHSNGESHCYDGFGAAFAAWLFYGDEAQYIPVVHGNPMPTGFTKDDDVFIVDFSYKRDELEDLKTRVNSLVVIDHHSGAELILQGLSYTLFDMSRSGALMAWQYWFPKIEAPTLIKYISDRDLWTKSLPYCDVVHFALSTYPQEFRVWHALARSETYLEDMITIGVPLMRQRDEEIDKLAATWSLINIGGHEVPFVDTDRIDLVSDALNKVCLDHPQYPFSASRTEGQDGGYKWSLRSLGFDVSEVARKFDGNGHRKAAGFQTVSKTIS